MRNLVLLISFLTTVSFVDAQYQLNGSTVDLGGGVYRMTDAVNSQFGSLWYKFQHDLNTNFNLQGQMNFGADAGGADGMCFVMQRNCLTAGVGGGGLGYSGITGQSFAVEFDTYQNITGTGVEINNDPVYDHIAVEKNGDVVHDASANDIVAPVQMHSTLANVKTGNWYPFKISYNATTHNLIVEFNGVVRVNITYDIKTSAFGGNQYAYWGFTSTTGGKNNIQQINIDNANSTLTMQDVTFCPGTINVALPSLSSLVGTNLALNKTVTASSGAGSKAQVNDGNPGSRWESAWAIDPSWIYVDLGGIVDIDSVVLDWEGAYATAFQVQTSTDAASWTTNWSTTTNTGGHNKIVVSVNDIRYVRIYGTARSLAPYGYSIWEFKVYGTPNYLWSPNNGTVSNIYGESVVITPTTTTTYTVSAPDACLGTISYQMVVTVSCVLPVELFDFTAEHYLEGALLKWSTASERDCDYFKVMRSNDGVNFEQIGQVDGHGNSNIVLHYSLIDYEKIQQIAYYQITSVDFDGTSEDSEIRALSTKDFNTINTILFENETQIILPEKTSHLHYVIYDYLGKEIENMTIENPEESFTVGGNLAPAYYFIKIETDSYVEKIKICKLN